MRKWFISLLVVAFIIPSTILNVKGATEVSSLQIDAETIVISDYMVTFETNSGLKCIYNVDTGLFVIDGIGSAVITTEVVKIYDDSMTEEEYLELDKEATLDSFRNLRDKKVKILDDSVVSTRSYYGDTGIPKTAPYVVALEYRKNIGQIVGELGEVIEVIGQITSTLASCPPIPQAELLEVVGLAVQASGIGLQALSSSLTSDWTYTMHRTKNLYTVGITTQYGYRYAHGGIIMRGTIDGKRYDAISYISDIVGEWWVSQKPF